MLDDMDDVVVREENPTSQWPPKGAFFVITGERDYGRVPWGVQPNYGWGWTFSYEAFDDRGRLVEAKPLHWRAFDAEVDRLGGPKAKKLDGAALEAWASAQPNLARAVLIEPMPGATFAGVRLVDREERKENPVAWKRAAAREVGKAQDRAAIEAIESKLRALRADRRASAGGVLAQCKASREEAVKRAKRLRKWANTTVEKAEAECRAERKEKGVATEEEKRLLAALAAEKEHQAKIRRELASQKKSKAPAKAKPRNEKRSESDDEVEGNISADLVPLWRKVKKTIKATDKLSRTEAFLKYVEENPDDAVSAIEDDSEDELAKMIREYERGAQKAYASNPTNMGALPPAYELSIEQLRRWGAPRWIDYGSVVHGPENELLVVQGFRVGAAKDRPVVTQVYAEDQRTGKSRYVDIASVRPSRQLNPIDRDQPTDAELARLYGAMTEASREHQSLARIEGELTRDERERKHRALATYNRLATEFADARRRRGNPVRRDRRDLAESRPSRGASTRDLVRNLMQRALDDATAETDGMVARQTRRIDHGSHGGQPYTITIQGRTNLTAPWIRLYSRELGRWSAGIHRDAIVGLPSQKIGLLAAPRDEEATHLEPICGKDICRRPNPTTGKKENPIIKGDEASFLRVREAGEEGLSDDEREVKIDPRLQVVHDPDGRFFDVCDAMFLRRSQRSADGPSTDTKRHTDEPSKAKRYYPSAELDENETLDRPNGPWHRVAQVDGIRYSRWFDEHGDGRYAQVPFQHPFSRPVVLEANGDESAYRLRLGSGCVWDERGLVVP